MLRVANIIEEARIGGPQIRMIAVAHAMSKDVQTTIIMPVEDSDAFAERCHTTGIPHQKISLTKIGKSPRIVLRYLFLTPAEILRLYRFLKRNNFDLVHASGGSWQFKAVIASRLAGVPVIWHLNDTSMPGFIRKVFRFLSPLATGFIFASHRSRAYYGDLIKGNQPEAIVPSTVDLTRFAPGSGKNTEDEAIEALDAVAVIGTVANINPIKGLEMLIRVAAPLQAAHPGLRVVVVGPVYPNQKAYAASLERLADQLGARIDWVGRRQDVRPVLDRLDIYVCSSLAESSPVSVWEAMAMAKPVVSTDVGDVARHIRNGENGFVVDVEDHEAMAKRIGQLLETASLRTSLGDAARKSVEIFAPEHIMSLTEQMYRRVLDETGCEKKDSV